MSVEFRKSRTRDIALVVAFFSAVAIATTYPLITRATSSLPAGLGDPAFVTFLLAWDADRIAHGFRGFWEAPYLFPHPHTLAYAEHLLGIALFTAPLQWLTRNPVLVYNAAFLGSYVLAGLGVFVLTRSLWGRSDAALLAGLAFVLSPYRMAQVTHLQVLMAGWMPLSLWGLHRYLASGSRRALAGFATAFVLQALSNGYYLYFFSLAVAAVIAVELARPRLPRRRLVTDLAAACAAMGAALSPFAWMYLRVQRQNAFDRPADDLFHYSARLSDYLTVPQGGWDWGGLLRSGVAERQLYPGIFAIGLAAVGVATSLRRGRANLDGDGEAAHGDAWRRAVAAYTLATLASLWVSLGPGAWWRPYGLLVRVIPGFSGMRVPARLGSIVSLGLVVLAAAGAARALSRLSPRVAFGAALVLGAIIAVEGRYPTSVDSFPPIDRRLDRAAYEWLRDRPTGAVVELRIAQQNDFHPFTLFYQFNTLVHRHRIVNGYSGWPSVLQEFLGGPAAPFDDALALPEVLQGLRAIGVRYLLLHEWTYPDAAQPFRIRAAVRAASDQIVAERQFDRTVAWQLAGAPARPAPPVAAMQKIDPASVIVTASHTPERLQYLFDGDVETRWISGARQTGNESIDVRLRRPRDLARMRIETSPRGLVDYPRHLVIESIDEQGDVHRLFDGSVLPALIESLAGDDRRAPVDIDFGANRTAILRVRQTGQTRRWFWGVHELTLWAR